MNRTISCNQLHPPKNNKDGAGTTRHKVYAKSGNATLELASALTPNAAKVFVSSLEENLKKLGGNISCNFLIIPKIKRC